MLDSLTLSNLPFNGNTPNLSRPVFYIPTNANYFALSPSVIIKEQNSEFLVPASLASSNLCIPKSLFFFYPVNYLASYCYYLALA